MNKTTKELLEDILEWLRHDGFINGVHYDDKSIIDEIERVVWTL